MLQHPASGCECLCCSHCMIIVHSFGTYAMYATLDVSHLRAWPAVAAVLAAAVAVSAAVEAAAAAEAALVVPGVETESLSQCHI